MGFCPNCGNWVDEGDVCGCCGGAGSYGYESDDDEPDLSRGNQSRSKIYSKKAWDLYMDFNDSEALRYIDMALDLDNRSSGCWNIRAIILEGMKRYAESLRCYDRSLELSFDSKVSDNKMKMLYCWVQLLIGESKELPNGLRTMGRINTKIRHFVFVRKIKVKRILINISSKEIQLIFILIMKENTKKIFIL